MSVNRPLNACIKILPLVAVMLLLLASCNLNVGGLNLKNTFTSMQRATGHIPVEEEIEIGGLVTSSLLGAAPLVADKDLQRYVNKVGMWVAQQTDRADLPWKFGVIESDNINAFAAPGGFILLTKGLFMQFNTEAELAGVLAHEIGHVVREHHLESLKKNARLDLLGDALTVASSDKSRKDRKKLDKLINAGTQMYARGLDRGAEYEADRLGVVYAARAGYDPYALLDVLVTLDSIKADAPSIALLTKTHPPFAERLQQLDMVVEGRLDVYAGQPALPERLQSIKMKLLQASSE